MKHVAFAVFVFAQLTACVARVDDPSADELTDEASGDGRDELASTNVPDAPGGAASTCSAEPRVARPASCPFARNDVVVWGEGWAAVADAFAQNISPCTDVFIAIAPASLPSTDGGPADKTTLRANQVSTVRKSPQIHALAEFHFGSWARKRRELGISWREVGHRFRDEMEAAGYCVSSGDTWAINEAPSTLRKSASFRADFAALAQGLAEGRPGMPFAKGVVFTQDFGHAATNLGVFKANLESMLADASFWTKIDGTVRFFADEVYADPAHVCMGATAAADRRRRVNTYTEHLPKLAVAGGAATAAARAYLAHAYVPLLSSAWDAVPEQGYGTTTIPLAAMEKHIRAEVDATRKFADGNATPDGRIGFAFVSYHDPSEWDALASTIAASVRGAYGENGTPAGACANGGCACNVEGAHENTAWATFGSW